MKIIYYYSTTYLYFVNTAFRRLRFAVHLIRGDHGVAHLFAELAHTGR